MKPIIFISLFLVCILVFSCKRDEEASVAQWPYGVKYEIFVMSFADGDGNGKGDFKGLTCKVGLSQGSWYQWHLAYAHHAIGHLSQVPRN